MYAVYIQEGPNGNKELIHSSYVDDLKLTNTKVVKAVDSIDSFSFSIYPNHAAYLKLNYLTTLVEVWNEHTNKLIFKGRALEPEDEMEDTGELYNTIMCEGELGYLHDSLQKWKKWQNMTPAQFFKSLIDEHNSQVEDYKKFVVGTVDVTNSTDNIYRYTDDDVDTYETIQDKLIDRLGGELQIRYENGVRYIDYLQQTGEKGSQKIELSVNLKSISRKIDQTDLITILKPLGERLEYEDENTDASSPRLTISSVNNGSLYLRDEKKIAQFGAKYGSVVWDDVTKPNILKTKGQDFMAKQKTALTQMQIDAVDIAPIDLTVEEFQSGWRYDVFNPLMGIDEEFRVIGLTLDLNNPSDSAMLIGDKMMTQEQYNVQIKKQAQAKQLWITVDNQKRLIGAVNEKVVETQQQIIKLEQDVASGTTEVQSQIQAIFDNLQEIANSIPDEEIIEAIVEDVAYVKGETVDLTNRSENLEAFQAEQITINQDFENRLSALEKEITK